MFSHKAAKIDFLTNDFYGTLNIQIFAYPEILIPGYPPSDKDFTDTFGDFTYTLPTLWNILPTLWDHFTDAFQ